MIKTNLLTIEIQNMATESTIKVELSNETMHKLYRIKEINDYDSLIEYKAYTKYCDKIKDLTNYFINSIEKDYYTALDDVEQGKLKNDTYDAIKLMDELILAGYDYKEASEMVSNKYLIKNR